ncbi:MAG TPA: peptidase, partial [Lachnospiraceae bacterium]|nr:peptidase [Lachnospiraceae bacterium]
SVQRVSGQLSDHYDPRTKVLRLSDSVYGEASVAAIGVAAHECGHAIQHDKAYIPLKVRAAFVPVANFGASLSIPLILIGVIFARSQFLINLGIWLFSLAVIFQLITLPVEFNASRRAVARLGETGILYGDEIKATKKVLGAAALTYVAGTAASLLQLLRLVLLFGGGRDRD